MPISFTPVAEKDLCFGHTWSIDSDNDLADLVARVALGQHRMVLRILEETGYSACSKAPTALRGAINLLTANDPEEPWHRDGWLFQVMSWIAANLQNNSSIIRPPHMIHAHKGFDGLHLDVDKKTGRVRSIVICEDKATGNARKMIRDHIWKEFVQIENGERDHELVAETSTLIATCSSLDADQAVEEIFWRKARAYRVAITVDKKKVGKTTTAKLFKGYQDVVIGDVARRQIEVVYLDDLRKWMQKIAVMAIEAAKTMEAGDV